LPAISGVNFVVAGDGSFTATVSGSRFGAIPSDIPCSNCTPLELQFTILANENVVQPITVTSWSKTSISFSGSGVAAGSAVRVAVYNAKAGNAGAWGGVIAPATGLPKITSIVATGSGQTLSITISGSGFGLAPSGIGSNVDSAFLVLTDFNAAAVNTGSGSSGGFPWNAGFCGELECDGVTANYVSWTNKKIVVSGFGGSYGNTPWIATPLDAFCVGVWPSSSTSDGTTGGVNKCIRLP